MNAVTGSLCIIQC